MMFENGGKPAAEASGSAEPAPRRLVWSALRLGDVILAREPAAMSRMIRRATGGEFSHALLCTDPPVLMEAVYKGAGSVARVDARNYYVKDSSNIRMLRLKRDAASDGMIAAAASHASRLFGAHMRSRARLSRRPRRPPPSRECSAPCWSPWLSKRRASPFQVCRPKRSRRRFWREARCSTMPRTRSSVRPWRRMSSAGRLHWTRRAISAMCAAGPKAWRRSWPRPGLCCRGWIRSSGHAA